jgi:hypothetical protein
MRRIVALLLLLVSPSLLFGAEPNLRAGAFAIDITPEQFPVSVND